MRLKSMVFERDDGSQIELSEKEALDMLDVLHAAFGRPAAPVYIPVPQPPPSYYQPVLPTYPITC